MEDFGDFLLPPSAFHVTQAVSPSVQRSSTETSGAKSTTTLTHDRMTVPNVQAGSVEEVDLPSSHQVASLLSRLTVAEAQLHVVEKKLLATHEEKVHLQRSYDEARLQLQHLRTYYHGRVEQEVEKEMPIKSDKASEKSRSTTTLDSRINELTNQIDILQKENSQVKSELELSILRSNSLEAALKLQDKQFSQASGGLMEQERTDKVFCFWRDHVLRLLVQLEQSKIEQEHSNGRMDRERMKMEKRLSDAQLELEATRHKLQASEAALTAVKGRAELLDSECHNQSTRLQTLEADIFRERHNMFCSLQSIKTNLATLSERVDNFAHAPTEGDPSTHGDTNTSVSELVRRMRHLERRLSFANNRLPLLRAQFILRSVVFSDRCDNWTQTENYSSGRTPSAMSNLELEELLTHTQNELRQCIAERDCALKKLEQNAKSFRERVRAAEDEVHTEVVGLRDLIVILEKDIKDKQEELNECQIQLDSVKSDHVKLQQDTANEQVQLHTQLSDAQKQLNKAMIELRRTERRVEREADERRTRITEMEKSYKSRIETLEQALRSFQPDSYKWQTARLGQDNAIKIDTNSTQNSGGYVTSAQLEVLTASVSQLTRLADCLKSSNESSDTENDQPEAEFQTTDKI